MASFLSGVGGKFKTGLLQKLQEQQQGQRDMKRFLGQTSDVFYDPYGLATRQTPGFAETMDPRGSGALLGAIGQDFQGESGRRTRRAITGLQASGNVLPGGYGTAALMANLGAASDMSRSMAGARSQSALENQRNIQDFGNRALDYTRDTAAAYSGFERQKDLQERDRRNQRRGLGITLGAGPVTVGLQRGGVVTRPTRALLGENGPEMVLPLGGRDLFAARAGMGRLGNALPPGAEMDGDPSTLPLDDERARLIQAILALPSAEDQGGPPTPFESPAPYRPKGLLEHLGAVGRNVRIGVGPESSGAGKALALALGGLSAVGQGRLEAGEAERERAQQMVAGLNRTQQEDYAARRNAALGEGRDLRKTALSELLKFHDPVTMLDPEARLDYETRLAKAKAQAEGGGSTKALQAWGLLNTAARTDPDLTRGRDIEFGRRLVTTGAKLGSGPGDIMLIYGYMKMLDPGSVVREGEYANAQNASGVPDRVRQVYNNLISGDKLAAPVREEFRRSAESLYAEVGGKSKASRERLRRVAQTFGVPEESLFDAEVVEPAGPGGRPPLGSMWQYGGN